MKEYLPLIFLFALFCAGCSSKQEEAYFGPRFIDAESMGGSGLPSSFSLGAMQSSTRVAGGSSEENRNSREQRPAQASQPAMSEGMRSVYEATRLGERTISVRVGE